MVRRAATFTVKTGHWQNTSRRKQYPTCDCVECNWQNVSELGVFRVVETVTLKIVNLLWSRDLCVTHCIVPDILKRNATPEQRERHVDIADVLLEEILKK